MRPKTTQNNRLFGALNQNALGFTTQKSALRKSTQKRKKGKKGGRKVWSKKGEKKQSVTQQQSKRETTASPALSLAFTFSLFFEFCLWDTKQNFFFARKQM